METEISREVDLYVSFIEELDEFIQSFSVASGDSDIIARDVQRFINIVDTFSCALSADNSLTLREFSEAFKCAIEKNSKQSKEAVGHDSDANIYESREAREREEVGRQSVICDRLIRIVNMTNKKDENMSETDFQVISTYLISFNEWLLVYTNDIHIKERRIWESVLVKRIQDGNAQLDKLKELFNHTYNSTRNIIPQSVSVIGIISGVFFTYVSGALFLQPIEILDKHGPIGFVFVTVLIFFVMYNLLITFLFMIARISRSSINVRCVQFRFDQEKFDAYMDKSIVNSNLLPDAYKVWNQDIESCAWCTPERYQCGTAGRVKNKYPYIYYADMALLFLELVLGVLWFFYGRIEVIMNKPVLAFALIMPFSIILAICAMYSLRGMGKRKMIRGIICAICALISIGATVAVFIPLADAKAFIEIAPSERAKTTPSAVTEPTSGGIIENSIIIDNIIVETQQDTITETKPDGVSDSVTEIAPNQGSRDC